MVWFRHNISRAIGVSAAALLAVLAALALGSPAQALPPPDCTQSAGYWIDGSHNIHAYNFYSCPAGSETPLGVSIQRYVSPGVWTTVASGVGETTYYCSGTALNIYRTTLTSQFFNSCG